MVNFGPEKRAKRERFHTPAEGVKTLQSSSSRVEIMTEGLSASASVDLRDMPFMKEKRATFDLVPWNSCQFVKWALKRLTPPGDDDAKHPHIAGANGGEHASTRYMLR